MQRITGGKALASVSQWNEGARLRTLPAAMAPVCLGSGMAAALGDGSLTLSCLCFSVAVLLQIGVNFANDYSDGVRGADQTRIGPGRLVASGENPRTVLAVAMAFFSLASLCALVLLYITQSWWLILPGICALLAAWFYTGGKHPYGYMGLGEVFVFLFFGWMATLGTFWVHTKELPWQTWFLASGVGLLSCALLMVNNLRDLNQDEKVGKYTLAVRLGDKRSRTVFQLFVHCAMLCSMIVVFWPWERAFSSGTAQWATGIPLQLVLWIMAIYLCHPIKAGVSGMPLVKVLRNTGLFTLAYGVCFAVWLVVF